MRGNSKLETGERLSQRREDRKEHSGDVCTRMAGDWALLAGYVERRENRASAWSFLPVCTAA